ncbi:MAG: endonuclease VII domain-containing protein [Spirochaetes bacterium]|nr:endonuclease VII domain-containing protein [Spirochaetota bacterium]
MLEVKDCQKVMRKNFNKPLRLTKSEEKEFKKATHCHICERKYKEDDISVRDHCHITGKYRGSAHASCNLTLQISAEKIKIPVITHNMKGYDGHLIMQEIGQVIKYENAKIEIENKKITERKNKDSDNGEEFIPYLGIGVIPCNSEKYMSFSIGKHLVFKDSFQFMSEGLSILADNLPKDKFIYTEMEFGEKASILKKKGVYPYDYMDSFSKFNNTKLPQKEHFYSLLTDEDISDDDYLHAQKVWNTFEIKNMGEYHDLYLKTDVNLLADVFENFRDTCMSNYKLDPCHYFTSPGLAWDAMLKMTKISLELITDIDQQLFVEKGMRGGISCITHRHAKANNKYMENYDPQKESSYIMYLDANNLYGWAMSKPLPYDDFKWSDESNQNKTIKEWLLSINTKNVGIGKIYEVDLEYAKELHDLHNDYPCAAEKLYATDDMLSDYCKEIKNIFKISNGKVHKLIPTLAPKKKYVLHEVNLKLYLKLGLKLTAVYRVIKFKEKPWLKQYIDFNTEKRKYAKNSFEKDFFKLMNNSVFGKTMENLRKRCNVYLETEYDHFMRQTAKPTYVSCKIFSKDLVAVNMKKERLKLDKPSYVGMCILDLSKTLMYDFHYNYIKKKYGKAQLLFTDTDSLCYHITTDDAYEDLYLDGELFDNSDYDKSSKFFFDNNKKVIGKFKDEAKGKPITEFVGLKSKMYSYKVELGSGNIKNKRKAKGVKKNIIKRNIDHSDYLDVLTNNNITMNKMKCIRSEYHQISSYEINKISLSCYDDKRYILSNGITSYAYGHWMVREINDITK